MKDAITVYLTHPALSDGAEIPVEGILEVHPKGNEALLTLHRAAYDQSIGLVRESPLQVLKLRTEGIAVDGKWKPMSALASSANDLIRVLLQRQ